jgi:hypothetical protein
VVTKDDIELLRSALDKCRIPVHCHWGREPGHPTRVLVEQAWRRWLEIEPELQAIAEGQLSFDLRNSPRADKVGRLVPDRGGTHARKARNGTT